MLAYPVYRLLILIGSVMRTGPNRGLSAGQKKVRPEEKVKKR